MPKEAFHNVLAWGDEERGLQEIQTKFLQYFPKGGKVLDLGSGRGIFLDLLKKGGFKPFGVEMDKTMHTESLKRGHQVELNDAITYLKTTKETFDGIFASHIIEHVEIEDGVALIELIKQRLKKGGVAIIVTPRPGSLWATENFWLDTTHRRPYPYELMKQLFQPFQIIAGGTEPDSSPIKRAPYIKKILIKIRSILLGKSLADFIYGGGVSYIVAKKP